jgi:hypothetical protein
VRLHPSSTTIGMEVGVLQGVLPALYSHCLDVESRSRKWWPREGSPASYSPGFWPPQWGNSTYSPPPLPA